MKNLKAKIFAGISVAAIAISLSACSLDGSSVAPTPAASGAGAVASGSVYKDSSTATGNLADNEDISKYDQEIFSEIHGATDEMTNDGERDITLNNPNRIGYVYVYASTGQLITFYTIKGKVSSTESQLTETQDIVDDPNCITGVTAGGNGSGYDEGQCSDVIDSIGDDGTYGGEEGGPNGVYFFTTAGALVELGGNVSWFYSDAPLDLTTKPIISYSDKTPTSGIASVPKK